MTVRIIQGDCLDVLRELPDCSVHCVVTSPPYYGLRDYDLPPTEWPEVTFSPIAGLPAITVPAMSCCHGLETDPWSFIAHEVLLFREVRRVLRDDGTLWLNIGDSYAGARGGAQGKTGQCADRSASAQNVRFRSATRISKGCKPKDMIGIPWMLAFALRSDGWRLRQDIIWSKPNPMPESVADRCTKAHEYLFLLSKSARYYFDQDAIAEPVSGTAHARRSYKTPDGWDTSRGAGGHGSFHHSGREKGQRKLAPPGRKIKTNSSFDAAVTDLVDSRNKRSVWTIATQPFSGAHFATFPPALVEPCILAGCPQGGVVLDPFGGAGTTGLVADRLQRDAVLIELSPKYAALSHDRIASEAPFLTTVIPEAAA